MKNARARQQPPAPAPVPEDLDTVPKDAVVPSWIPAHLVSRAAIAREVIARLDPCIRVCEDNGLEAAAAYMKRARVPLHTVVLAVLCDRADRAPEPEPA